MRTNFIHEHLALESVAFQSPEFFKELTLVWTEMSKVAKDQVKDNELFATASAIIQKFTNLKTSFNISIYGPAVEIPALDKNNVLVNSFLKNWVSSTDGLKMVRNSESLVRGGVSLMTGKVTGVFTEIVHQFHFPTEFFTGGKFTPQEMAAVTLHEIGHLLTYYEYVSRSVTTNQALAGVSKALDGSGDIEERNNILISAKKALNLKDLDTEVLAECKDQKVTEIVIITSAVRQAESELGSNVYDFSTWEYLSDQYATRMGAGRELVTALDKLYGWGNINISYRSTFAYVSMEAVKLLALVASLAFLPATGGSSGLALVYVAMWCALDGNGDGTYDRPGARMKRVRAQLVENLKDKKLPAERVNQLSEDIVVIDNILKEIEDRRQWLGILWDTLVPSARRAYKQEKLQKELEALAYNDLFVKAAEMRRAHA